MVRKFIPLEPGADGIELVEFLEKLEAATCFDPKNSAAQKGENLLWDYQKKLDNQNEFPELFQLKKEELHHLKNQVWTNMDMPERFITESEWNIYQATFNGSENKPNWFLAPTFIPNPNKKISTWTHHYFKLRKLVEEHLKSGNKPIYFQDQRKASIRNFGAGIILSIALIAAPYIDSEIDFIGDPPVMEDVKRGKLNDQDEEVEKTLLHLGVDKLDIPTIYAGNRFSIKLSAWKQVSQKGDLFPTKESFNHSWRRLRRNGRIKYSNETEGSRDLQDLTAS